MKGYQYLASPYSHPDATIREARYLEAVRATALLMNAGEIIFSPIAHSHPIAVNHSLPLDWQFWEAYDRAFIQHCEGVIVLMLDGWRESKGVKAEIEIAKGLGWPVRYLTIDEKGALVWQT